MPWLTQGCGWQLFHGEFSAEGPRRPSNKLDGWAQASHLSWEEVPPRRREGGCRQHQVCHLDCSLMIWLYDDTPEWWDDDPHVRRMLEEQGNSINIDCVDPLGRWTKLWWWWWRKRSLLWCLWQDGPAHGNRQWELGDGWATSREQGNWYNIAMQLYKYDMIWFDMISYGWWYSQRWMKHYDATYNWMDGSYSAYNYDNDDVIFKQDDHDKYQLKCPSKR